MFGFDNQVAETFGHRDIDAGKGYFVFAGCGQQFFIGIDTGFGFGLAGFGVFVNPFQFVGQRFLAGGFFSGFLLDTFLFLFQPGRIVAFVRNALSAVEFQNPAGNVI